MDNEKNINQNTKQIIRFWFLVLLFFNFAVSLVVVVVVVVV